MKKVMKVLLAIALSSTTAQAGGREGHGGETQIGPEYYSIAYRLIEAVPEYPLAEILKSAYSIRPTTEKLEIESGVAVEAISSTETEDGHLVYVTRVQKDLWDQNDCRGKNLLVLHEMLTLLGIEASMSYNFSTPVIERLVEERTLNCQVLAMKTGCQPAYLLKGKKRDQRNDILRTAGVVTGLIAATAGGMAGGVAIATSAANELGLTIMGAGVTMGSFAGGLTGLVQFDYPAMNSDNSNKFLKIANLLNEAEANRQVPNWFLKKLAKKDKRLRSMNSDEIHAMEIQVANILAEGNQKQEFCPMDLTGKALRLMRPNKLVKYVQERIRF